MASTSYQTPDLASVLATLAAHAPTPQLTPTSRPSSPPFTPAPAAPQKPQELEEGEYDPAEYDPSIPPPSSSTRVPPPPSVGFPPSRPPSRPPSTGASHALSSDPRLKSHTPVSHPPLSNPSLGPPTPSPSKITTWPPALRHVTKLLIPDPDFTRRITHLIHTQHKHERQWWSGREALVQKLEGREEGRRKLNEVLASVGGIAQPITSDSSPSSSSPSELVIYDRKVHRACTEMSAATTAELARLGVPFFALDPALIITNDKKEEEEEGGVGGGEHKDRGAGGHNGKISRKEVEEFKRRMLTLLQDLCGD